MKLKNKRAIITGANRGIGRAIAVAFAREGASLALAARDTSSLTPIVDELHQNDTEIVPVALDVTRMDDVARATQAVLDGLGGVDVVVNNAGIAGSVKVEKMDDAHWQSHLDINLTGTFRVTRAFLPTLTAQRSGRVINIASIAGKVGYRYTAAYCASKHGVIGFTRALALEVAEIGITVNAICPGFVRTDMADRAVENIAKKTGASEEQALEGLEALSPQKRLIEPDEVAALAVMLASDDARGITGQAINIDGGTVTA